MTELQNLPPGSVDILTLSAPQLSSLQSRLSQELEHLTTSYTRLRSAQARFRDCIASIKTGVDKQADRTEILVPLTQSLYVPGQLADTNTVIVDVGTGFYVEKSTAEAIKFYNGKVDDLSKNLGDLEKVVQGKNENLRIVEEVLRQKVMAAQASTASAAG